MIVVDRRDVMAGSFERALNDAEDAVTEKMTARARLVSVEWIPREYDAQGNPVRYSVRSIWQDW